MSIIRLAVELFALYLLYKLIFDFIIPIARTTKQVKKQFGDMSAQMQEKMNQHQQSFQQNTNTTARPEPVKDDYIDFEEVKK